MNSITFEIKENVGTIRSFDNGWTKELNIVSWNQGTPKYDIRDWSEDHQRMTKGITLSDEDAKILCNLLKNRVQ